MHEVVFDLPVRIYWTPGPAASDEFVAAVRRSRPLAVALNLKGVEELRPLDLPWDGVSASAVFHGWKDHQGVLPDGEVSRWEFPVEDTDDVNRIGMESFCGVSASRAFLRFVPLKGELKRLPEIMESASRWGCGLTLPNRTVNVITTRGGAAFPDPVEFDEVTTERLQEAACAMSPGALRVHDYILSRILKCEATETGGCQAANAVAFVDKDGMVYPCESFKIPMGNLHVREMASIWSSPARKEFLKEMRKLPVVCRACEDLPACSGGCRGEAYHRTGMHGNPDPICPRYEAKSGD